jgi:hypothetical protein
MSNLSKFAFVSKGNALSCTVISAFGIVTLVSLINQFVLGTLYNVRAEKLVYNKHPPKDAAAVARACFIAAFIYAGFFVLCFCQVD